MGRTQFDSKLCCDPGALLREVLNYPRAIDPRQAGLWRCRYGGSVDFR
ncbi:hypothetical protein [Candidatus Methanocrinis natronophilus]|nr:hypothetical protein [Candidatus Methanocrinis natronophilus]